MGHEKTAERHPRSDRSAAGPGHLHVEEAGSGSAVLCLHGIGSSSASFRHQLAALSHTRRVLAWDAPGFGRSDDPAAAPGMDGYADGAARLLADRGIDQAHIIGTSFGGVVAVRLALRHPRSVRSLVLADTTPGSGGDPRTAAAMRQRGATLQREGKDAFCAARAARLLSAGAPAALVDEVRRVMAASIRLPGYGWAAEAMSDTDHLAALASLHVPTLVVCGSEDRVTPPALAERITTTVPGARLRLIEGAGHVSNQERPDRFNELVGAFLDEVEHVPVAAGAAAKSFREDEG